MAAGRIPELETIITVNIKNADRLDKSIGLAKGIEGADDLTSYLTELKSELNNIRTPVAEMAADELITSERDAMRHHNKTGKMSQSIDKYPNGEGSYIVGTSAHSDKGFPYPMSIETGRKEVRPINPGVKFLHWVDDGQHIFAKKSRATDADPYVDKGISNAWRRIEDNIDVILGGLGV